MFLKAYEAFLDEFWGRKSHIFIFLSDEKISKKSINLQISWNFMNFEGWRLGITGSDLDVLKSFYRYVIVSLDFPLHTENVFRSLPSVFGWILGQEKPHFHIFVKWENLRTKKEMIFSHNLELNYWSCFYDTVSMKLNTSLNVWRFLDGICWKM